MALLTSCVLLLASTESLQKQLDSLSTAVESCAEGMTIMS